TESSRSFADLSPSSSWTNQSSSPFGPEKKPSTVTISEARIRLMRPPIAELMRRCTRALTADAPETHRRLAQGRSCPHRNAKRSAGKRHERQPRPPPPSTLPIDRSPDPAADDQQAPNSSFRHLRAL